MSDRPLNLVTGGSGVLGRALAARLAQAGEAVRVFDLRAPEFAEPGLEFAAGDVTDARALSAAARGCVRVFHLAVALPQARLSEQEFERINVGGTANAAEACLANDIETMVFASSIEIYGPQRSGPLDEQAEKLFTGPYSRNKLACENLLLSYRRRGLRVSFARMPMILGPGFYHERSMLRLMRSLSRGLPIPLPAADLPYSVVAAADAAEALRLMALSSASDGRAFNVAAPDSPEVKRLFRELCAAIGSRSRIVAVPMWLLRGFVRLASAVGRPLPLVDTPPELIPYVLTGGAYDISKARRLLGYAPTRTCLDCLIELYHLLQDRDGQKRA